MMQEEAKVLIAGYPKSGNTWLGYMVAYLLGARYVDLHQPNAKPTLVKSALHLISGKLEHKTPYSVVAKTHALPQEMPDIDQYDKILYIVRDPRDVAVSYYFFQYRHLPIHLSRPIILHLLMVPPVPKILKMQMVFKVAKEWPFHVLSWKALHTALVIQYETLHRDPAAVLKRILQFLEISADESRIQNAIHSFSFEQMSGGRKPGDEDPYHFYRKGIIGDHKSHLTHLERWLIEKLAKDPMRQLGYLE